MNVPFADFKPMHNELEKEIKKGNIILISSGSKHLLKYIVENNIKYCLVYAGENLQEEYEKRMRERKNNKKFIDKMINNQAWKESYIKMMKDLHIKLNLEAENI